MDHKLASANFLASLNQAQQRAAFAPPGPWLVLAGPGTGKTRTLVARIISLIERYHIKPNRLLAVTYTNKATEEMKERLAGALGQRAQQLTVSTFHAFCINILRECHEQANLAKHFSIADDDCQLRIIARIAPMLRGERHMRHLIGRFSGVRLNPNESKPLSGLEQQLQRRYESELRKNCLIDFDDILFYTQRLCFEQPAILNRYRRAYDAVLIDEFQDTDRVQYEIIKQLVSEHNNLFVVADDDQSIFSWRGANPSNIDLFCRDFAKENIVVLTENYRSRPEIIEQAKAIINQTSRIVHKQLQAVRHDWVANAKPVKAVNFSSDNEEATFIINDIQRQLTEDKSLSYADFAVLYARHSVGEFLEHEFMKFDLPCQLVRGRSSFDQPEIIRALSLMKVLHNPKDQYSLEEFVAREVDEVTYTRLKTFQREETLTDFRLALDRFRKRSWIPEQERRQIERIIGIISNLLSFKEMPGKRLSELFAEIINSLSNQEILTLMAHIEQLTDPIFYNRMREAARTLFEARNIQRPVLVAATNTQINFIAIEMLKRSLGLNVSSAHSYVVQQVVAQTNNMPNQPQATKPTSVSLRSSQPATLQPLLIILDGEELKLLTETIKSCSVVIYLGTDYSPERRNQLRAVNAIIINPEELIVVERGFEPTAIGLLFKLCQATVGLGNAEFLPDYVALDIETTDKDVETNDIIELGAIRVRDGLPVDNFHSLIKPNRPIATDAAKVHGINDADLTKSPTFAEVVTQFLTFIGQDVLVAHNGYSFDFPCINRKLRELGRPRLENRTFDTLPMANRLFPDRSASLDALASVFAINVGTRHRALDDTLTLVEVFERLKKEHASRLRRTACEPCLDLLAAGVVLEQGRLTDTNAILVKEGMNRLAVPNSLVIEKLAEQGDIQLLRSFVEEAKVEQLREGGGNADRFAAFLHFDDIVSRFDCSNPIAGTLPRSIQDFLDFAALYQQQDGIARRNAVHLMTIYASKGLEFNRVYIAGLEQNMLPSFYAIGSRNTEQLAEQRRLFYVAITRAKEQLTFTTAATRNGYAQIVSEFLTELLSLPR